MKGWTRFQRMVVFVGLGLACATPGRGAMAAAMLGLTR